MPNGSVEMTLKDKELKPFDGYRRIIRMSEIVFNELAQKFFVHFRHSGFTTKPIFDTYEDAVAYEIDYINKERMKGISFDYTLTHDTHAINGKLQTSAKNA